ncbi:HupE/UreJ family protein [Pseudaminobacter sp. 19-2017]|uniref:HupE/UreJ family protein n=1 Tax=Pseudaminobacter soli (ex Zhang et al. 2022) TaxID=2831468 RepID=A0A942I493_9HYPH|nr:HupE/UreJ family protein [Pseudaminobacter soli]MBS3652517.1 HupE/UreJ family protein [Pseudaminobacter soli]
MPRRAALLAAALVMTTVPAFAHPGHGSGAAPFLAGLVHPLSGLDHVVAMVAVGLWAAFLGWRASWMVSWAFIVGIVGGFALAATGIQLPFVEAGIAASVLVLGLLVVAAVRLPLGFSAFIAGVFAVFHGHAHGTEAPDAMLLFGAGFVVTSAMLQAAGIGIGRLLAGPRFALARALGAGAAGIGLALLGGPS